jgi:hypothetical protein
MGGVYSVRTVCKISFVKHEGKRLLGRPRCKWEDNIERDHMEKGLGVWLGFI